MESNKALVVSNKRGGGGGGEEEEEEELIDLPPGFRFHPTDEEIITCYLTEKVMNSNFSASAIGEADLNKCEPWDLPKKAKMGEKEWYFFCQRDRKYPTGMRTNRATESGYWKATGKDKEIYKGKTFLVGMKKTLVFYKGRAPKGEKTNWVMHEYRLEGHYSYYNLPKCAKDEWVVCRVFHKNMGMKKTPIQDLMRMNSLENIDNLLDYSSLPALMDPPYSNTTATTSSSPQGQNSNYHRNYFYDHQQQNQKINFQLPNLENNSNIINPIQNPNLYSQFQVPNQPYSFQTITPNIPNYFQTNFQGYSSNLIGKSSNAIAKNDLQGGQSKLMEQFSSNQQSMVSLSQDTGLSSDLNNTTITTTTTTTTEISSVVKQEMASNNISSYNHQDHSFESFWDDL